MRLEESCSLIHSSHDGSDVSAQYRAQNATHAQIDRCHGDGVLPNSRRKESHYPAGRAASGWAVQSRDSRGRLSVPLGPGRGKRGRNFSGGPPGAGGAVHRQRAADRGGRRPHHGARGLCAGVPEGHGRLRGHGPRVARRVSRRILRRAPFWGFIACPPILPWKSRPSRCANSGRSGS